MLLAILHRIAIYEQSSHKKITIGEYYSTTLSNLGILGGDLSIAENLVRQLSAQAIEGGATRKRLGSK